MTVKQFIAYLRKVIKNHPHIADKPICTFKLIDQRYGDYFEIVGTSIFNELLGVTNGGGIEHREPIVRKTVTAENWQFYNDRRIQLIDKDIFSKITEAERVELDILERQMEKYLDEHSEFRFKPLYIKIDNDDDGSAVS